jgi:iron complex outermembrane receptor protein
MVRPNKGGGSFVTKRNQFWLCTAAALALGAAGEARAQAPEDNTISEVVVTAQRRSEVLENVPMAVTVLTPETLERANVKNFMELGKVAPGLQMNYAGGVPGVALHGVTTLVSAYVLEANVGTYIDGFYQPQMITIASDLANLSSVEVLKGPQGTLYGRNATGGAILINTLGPSETFTGKFDATYASFDDKIVNAYVAGPLSDRVRFSLSGHGRRADGWIKFADPTVIGGKLDKPAAPIKEAGFRAKLEADVTDNLTALAAMNYSYSENYQSNLITFVGHINPAVLTPVPPARPVGFGKAAAYNHSSRLYGVLYEPTLKLTYRTPIGTLNSYTGWAHRIVLNEFDFDGSYVDTTYTKVVYGQNTFQQTFDYQIDAIDKLDLVVGASYYDDRAKTDPAILSYGPNFNLTTLIYFAQITKAWAGYFDGTYHLTDKLSISAGGRYTHETKRANTVITGRSGAPFPGLGPVEDSHSWNKFTPRFNVRYELAPRTSIYASFAQGFRSGIYNTAGPTAGLAYKPISPEKITSYEVGLKTAKHWVRFHSSLFYYDYKDVQSTIIVPNPLNPATVTSILQNAGDAEIYGWDNELTLNPTERLTIRGNLALLHARYKNFEAATGTGVNALNTINITNQLQDWSGKRMSRAPDVSGNVAVDYQVPISYGSLLFNANVNFTSQYAISNPSLYGPLAPVELRGKQRFIQKSYALLGASVTWTDPSENYSVTVYGTNLTDEVYRMGYNASIQGDYSTRGEPRAFGVRVGAKF